MPRIGTVQKVLLTFVLAPVVLGYAIYKIEFTTGYVENPYPGITAAWNTWRAYEHEWCYILAFVIWFALSMYAWRDRPGKPPHDE